MLSQLSRSISIFMVAARLLGGYLWFNFSNRFRGEAARERAKTALYRHWGRLLREAALHLEGLIIKVGQFMSARADVLPPVFTQELAGLQDEVPPAPSEAIREQVENELNAPLEQVFQHFEPEALAAASLGQVHAAVLRDGRGVAVKVLRPGIERVVAIDLSALRKVMWFLMRFTNWARRIDLPALMDEFEKIVGEEMDYIHEAENLRTFRRNLGLPPSGPEQSGEATLSEDNGNSEEREAIQVPYPIEPWITRRVLVMEFVNGIKPTDRAALVAAGVDGPEVARRLVRSYIKQILLDGFVHVDPHPGNIYVHADQSVVLMDFGMTVTVTNDDRTNLEDLVKGLMLGDMERAVAALRGLGVLSLEADATPLKQALEYLLDRIQGVGIRPSPDFERFLDDFQEWLYEEPLQFPTRFMFLGRAAGLLAGVVSSLDPEFDWVTVLKEEALPLLDRASTRETDSRASSAGWKQLVGELFGPEVAAALNVVADEALSVGKSLVRLPGRLDRTLERLESDSLSIQVDMRSVVTQLERQSRLLARLHWSLLTAGAAITATLLGLNGYGRGAWLLGGAACLFLVFSFFGAFAGSDRSRHRRFHPH